MIGICYICKEEKNLSKKYEGNKICYACYIKYIYIFQECGLCHEYGIIKSSKTGIKICEKCYRDIHPRNDTGERPLHICCECGREAKAKQKTEKGYICSVCYNPPKQICSVCGEENIVRQYINKQPICPNCYEQPKAPCSICGTVGPIAEYINNNPIGHCCYRRPAGKCDCGNISILTKGKCTNCYMTERRKREDIRIIDLLRSRLYLALKLYSKTGKIKHADEYGIDYEAIIKHLGPCPGDRGFYHIDHFFPLVAFDLNNPIHILAAFAVS